MRNWDELRGVVESGLVSQSTINSYIERLQIKDGKVDLESFMEFMSMVSRILP